MKVNMYAVVGKHGQAGLHDKLPFERSDHEFLKSMIDDGLALVGARSADKFPFLSRVLTYSRIRDPKETIDSIRARYWDRDIWVLGGYRTWGDFSPLVNGRKIINVVEYDGEADTWFPFDAYGIKMKASGWASYNRKNG